MGHRSKLGRGAMGVTYKAVDVNLRYAVALKVINARFIGDESARRRGDQSNLGDDVPPWRQSEPSFDRGVARRRERRGGHCAKGR
jgi:serine/threonine protein kinase